MTFCERIRKSAQSFMRANGFAFKKGIFCRIENDMAFCVNLEMPTGTVYSNCFVLPLYVPTEFCYMTYGTRLTVGAAERDGDAENAAELADKLMSILSNDIFPCFQTITSPDAFFTQVSHRALFAPHECRISDVFVQRLRLATAFYEKRYSEIPEICGEYMKVLADAPYLPSGCKKIYLDEIRLFQNAMTLSDPEAASGPKTGFGQPAVDRFQAVNWWLATRKNGTLTPTSRRGISATKRRKRI